MRTCFIVTTYATLPALNSTESFLEHTETGHTMDQIVTDFFNGVKMADDISAFSVAENASAFNPTYVPLK
jgi:hypothetical protein